MRQAKFLSDGTLGGAGGGGGGDNFYSFCFRGAWRRRASL